MSERAQRILTWLTSNSSPIFLRQQSLAEQFGCSRRTIGRALYELKEAGLLIDLNKRHANRCKLYEVKIPLNPPFAKGEEKEGLTPEAARQWRLFEKTFRITFTMPNLEQLYAQVTWDLEGVQQETELWSKTFAGLWAITGYLPTEKVFDPRLNSWFYRVKE